MKKNRFNDSLALSIKRKKLMSSKHFFLRLLSNPDMFLQSILCLFLSKFNLYIPLKTYTFWGIKMNIILPEVVSSEIRRYGYIEDSVASFIINFCKSKDQVIDVGSHFGFFALLMSEMVGDKGSVHCFEPTPSSFSILKKNVIKKSNIITNENAVMDKNIEIELNDFGLASSAFNSINNTRQNKNLINQKSRQKKILVKSIILDDYVIENNLRPSLIKIDAESSEYEVIKGMDFILNKLSPVLCIELGDLGIKGVLPSRKIIDFLIEKYGYKPYEIKNSKLNPHKLKEKYNYINLFFKK